MRTLREFQSGFPRVGNMDKEGYSVELKRTWLGILKKPKRIKPEANRSGWLESIWIDQETVPLNVVSKQDPTGNQVKW